MPSPKIDVLRLSMIWTLPVRIPAATPLGPLADDRAYEQVFAAPRGPAAAPRFEPPWLATSSSTFWAFYLSRQPRTVDGAIARAHLVPVRERLPAVKTTLGAVRVVAEGFYAHTGIAVVITAVTDAPLDVPDAIDRAVALRRARVIEHVSGPRRAEDLAAELLSTLHANVAGVALPAGALAPPPCSIATVVQLEGLTELTPVAQGDERHRIVDALAHLEPDWRTTTLPELAGLRLDVKQSPASHLLYARGAARTVWFPSYARAGTERPTRLTCYHRNLTFASMQTELLLGCSALLSRLRDAPSTRESDDLMRVHRLLARLYGRHSYRTSSVLAQITARKAEVDGARAQLGLPPL